MSERLDTVSEPASVDDITLASQASEDDLKRYVYFKRQGAGCPICGAVGVEAFVDSATHRLGLIKIVTSLPQQMFAESGFYPAVAAGCTTCGFFMKFYVVHFARWLRTVASNG